MFIIRLPKWWKAITSTVLDKISKLQLRLFLGKSMIKEQKILTYIKIFLCNGSIWMHNLSINIWLIRQIFRFINRALLKVPRLGAKLWLNIFLQKSASFDKNGKYGKASKRIAISSCPCRRIWLPLSSCLDLSLPLLCLDLEFPMFWF